MQIDTILQNCTDIYDNHSHNDGNKTIMIHKLNKSSGLSAKICIYILIKVSLMNGLMWLGFLGRVTVTLVALSCYVVLITNKPFIIF